MPLVALILAGMPLLMLANHESVGAMELVISGGMLLLGSWGCLYFAKYSVTVSPEGLSLLRLWRRPSTMAWREVVAVRDRNNQTWFETADHRAVAISWSMPAYAAVMAAAAEHLPDVVFGGSYLRPAPAATTPDERRREHAAMGGFYRRATMRCLIMGVPCLVAGFVFERIEGPAFDVASAIAYRFGIVNTLLAVLFWIMRLQEIVRLRRVR